ncbi:MAG: GNAT family N-acetyltransferase [Actinobacteria bacterium]|nr:GNAT family N-acetyltransferase [Actinomycetota bacterium]
MSDAPASPDVRLVPAFEDEFAGLGRRLQAAFAVALQGDPHHDPALEPIPSDDELKSSFKAPRAEVLHVTVDGERVGGMVLSIDPASRRNTLDLLFIDPEYHSRGLGRHAWLAAEQRHPDTRVWETATPHFEIRNIHFYINVCGFHIVEFFNPHHLDPHPLEDGSQGEDGHDDLMFRFEKVMPGPVAAPPGGAEVWSAVEPADPRRP